MKRIAGAVCTVGLMAAAWLLTTEGFAVGASYTYDELGRLVAVIYDDNTGEVYGYDNVGNRTSFFSGHPTVFSVNNKTVSEGNVASVAVTRAGDATTSATVAYSMFGGSAVVGTNYTPITGTLTFAVGTTSKNISITTIDDNTYNTPLTFTVRLQTPSTNAALGANDATVTINNTDAAPSFAITNAGSVNEGTSVAFTVTKTNPSTLTHAVNYATSNGTATSGADYTGASNTLTFTPGQTTQTFNVPTATDAIWEGNETFTATLSAATAGAVIGTASSVATVVDTNTAPVFSINTPVAQTETQTIGFVVTRTGGSTLAHAVNYATSNGTAIAGTNYTSTSGTLTFPAGSGDTTQVVPVPTLSDGVTAAAKTFTMTLSSLTNGATLGQATGTGTINNGDGIAPDMPASISPTTYYTTSGYYPVEWTPPPNGIVTKYDLYEWTSVDPGSIVYSGTALSRSFTKTECKIYRYKVRACNGSLCSAYRTQAAITVVVG